MDRPDGLAADLPKVQQAPSRVLRNVLMSLNLPRIRIRSPDEENSSIHI